MTYKKGLMLVFFTALVSGLSIFINSFGVKGFDSSVFTFSKNIVVALFLFSIILLFNQFNELKKLNRKHWSQLITIGFIGGSIPFLLFFKGLQMTTGTTSAFIHKTIFIYAAVFALLFLKERLAKGFFIGALLLLFGNYFLIEPDFHLSIGHLLVLAAAVFWAAENVLAKHVLKRLSGNIVAFGRMFFGSFFILLFLAFTGKLSLVFSMSFEQYLWVLLTSVFLLLYAVLFYNGLKYVKVATAACVLALGSPITALLDFIFSGNISINQSIGILFILAGIASIVYSPQIVLLIRNAFLLKQNERN